MHVFLYEWATGGGLVEEPGGLPASLIREGGAMVMAVATDLARTAGIRVSVLRDPRLLDLALPGCDVVDVLSRPMHYEELERIASEADATILIAPEFDGILTSAVERCTAKGARLVSPALEFVRLAADKHGTCEHLAGSGVLVPEGVLIESDEPLPEDFPYPAVIKPNDGAGSQDTFLIAGPHDAPAYAWARRLERYLPGMAASVAVLCGPGGNYALQPSRQILSDDGRMRYRGGELPIAGGLAERAARLAERAVAALPPVIGYVGVDMVLGNDPEGRLDAVIEINPRITTSYVGLRAAARCNIAEAMLKVARGEAATVEFSGRAIEFDSAGNVSYRP